MVWEGEPEGLAAVVQAAMHGSNEAFEALIDAYDHEVRRTTRDLLRDPSDAEDAAQEVWLRVARNIARLGDPRRFRAWLRRIARNTSLNFRRDDREHAHRYTGPDDPTYPAADQSATRPEDQLLAYDAQRKVWEVLGSMSENDRRVLRLRELDQLGYREIGRILSTSSHAAEVRTARARDRFRTRFNKIDDERAGGHANVLRLRSAAAGDGRVGVSTLAADHVRSCRVCRARVSAMRLGRRVFTGLAQIALAPVVLWRELARMREGSHGGTEHAMASFVHVPSSLLGGSPAFEWSTNALSGAGTVFAAATLSFTLTFACDDMGRSDIASTSDEPAVDESADAGRVRGPVSKFALDAVASSRGSSTIAIPEPDTAPQPEFVQATPMATSSAVPATAPTAAPTAAPAAATMSPAPSDTTTRAPRPSAPPRPRPSSSPSSQSPARANASAASVERGPAGGASEGEPRSDAEDARAMSGRPSASAAPVKPKDEPRRRATPPARAVPATR